MIADKEIRLLIFVMIGLFFMLLGFLVAFVVAYHRKQIQGRREREQLKTRYNQELLKAKLEIKEQTLVSIAQEIHDNIGQTLSLAKLNLNLLKTTGGAEDEKLLSTKHLVSKAVQDLRNMARTMHTDTIISQGLVKAIRLELNNLEKTGVYAINFQVLHEPYPFDKQKELIIFRIFQEACSNIIKHAAATELNIEAYFEPDHFSLTIGDNGKGFETTLPSGQGGLGIQSMKSRTELLGGSFKLISNAASGTRLTISIPR